MKKNCLIKIIENNNLSIKNNPFGSKRLWPYSYIEFFYNSFCNELYKINKSPSILEVNQKNNLDLKIWNFIFDKPNIKNFTLENIKQNKYDHFYKFDMIIVNNKDIANDQEIFSNLISFLNSNGSLIIENIGRESKSILKIYQNYFMKLKIDIHDFRFKKFILKNGLLIIKKKKIKYSIFYIFRSLILLFKFLFNEFMISLLVTLIKIKLN